MKTKRSPTKPVANDSDLEQAIGGQPENDRDARDAGLPSATSAGGAKKTKGKVSQARAKAQN